MKKFCENTVFLICLLLLVWMAMSFIDVVAHNCSPDPIYADWNLFALLF